MRWLAAEFGADTVRRPIVTPTAEFFPDPYSGTRADAERTLRTVARRIGVDADGVRLAIGASGAQTHYSYDGATTAPEPSRQYRPGGRVTVSSSALDRPIRLIAEMARGLARVRLFDGGRLDTGRTDSEQVADLSTVFFGFGVFTANSVRTVEVTYAVPGRTNWKSWDEGFLSEPMYGYALARYAELRGESRPRWAKYLDTNPKAYLRQSLRWLSRETPAAPD